MRVLRGVLLCVALVAFGIPAYATPPVFNGDLISATLPQYNVKFYGAKCDGTTNDASAISAAVTAATNAGGGRILIPGICAVGSTITVTGNDVYFVGLGDTFNAATVTTGALKWTGSSGGTIISFQPPGSCVSACYVAGGGVSDISLMSNGLAAVGIAMKSMQGGDFERITGDAFSESWIESYIATNGQGTMHNVFVRLSWVNEGTNGGHGVWLKGGEFNTIIEYFFGIGNGDALRFGGGSSDSNASDTSDFNHVADVHGIYAGGATGHGVVFDCGSWSNEIDHISDKAILARGTTTCTGTLGRSFANSLRHYDKCDDALPDPTVETGSSMWWDDDCGGKTVTAIASGQVPVKQKWNTNIDSWYAPNSGVLYLGQMNTDNPAPILMGNATGVHGITYFGTNSAQTCANSIAATALQIVNYGGQVICWDGTNISMTGSGAIEDGTGGFIFANQYNGATGFTNLLANTSTIQGKTCGLLALVNVGHGTYACFDLNGSFATGGGGFFQTGVQPDGSSGGWVPEYFPLGVSATHPKVMTGTCATVATTGTVCTFPNSFAFADATYTCRLTAEGSTAAYFSYDTKTTTSFKAYSNSGTPTVDYECSR